MNAIIRKRFEEEKYFVQDEQGFDLIDGFFDSVEEAEDAISVNLSGDVEIIIEI